LCGNRTNPRDEEMIQFAFHDLPSTLRGGQTTAAASISASVRTTSSNEQLNLILCPLRFDFRTYCRSPRLHFSRGPIDRPIQLNEI
jgi:hypothetical protein